jgi:hypothetical protein
VPLQAAQQAASTWRGKEVNAASSTCGCGGQRWVEDQASVVPGTKPLPLLLSSCPCSHAPTSGAGGCPNPCNQPPALPQHALQQTAPHGRCKPAPSPSPQKNACQCVTTPTPPAAPACWWPGPRACPSPR